jgi:hypothetical protein
MLKLVSTSGNNAKFCSVEVHAKPPIINIAEFTMLFLIVLMLLSELADVILKKGGSYL